MKISAFYTLAEPEKLMYPYYESIKSVLSFCDEVVVVFAASETPQFREFEKESLDKIASLGSNSKPIKIYLEKEWPHQTDSKYENTRKYLQTGLELCSGDLRLKIDGDQIFRRDHADFMLSTLDKLMNVEQAHHIVFPRINFFSDNYYNFNTSNSDIYIINHAFCAKQNVNYKISPSKEFWGRPAFDLDKKNVKSARINNASLLPVNYDCTFFTKSRIINHWRMTHEVYSKELGIESMSSWTNEKVFNDFLNYQSESKMSSLTKILDFHPKDILERIDLLNENHWGFNNFGIVEKYIKEGRVWVQKDNNEFIKKETN